MQWRLEAREDRLPELWVIRERRSSAGTLQSELVQATRTKVSTKIIRKLHRRQLHARKSARVPSLSPANRRSRRLFAEDR